MSWSSDPCFHSFLGCRLVCKKASAPVPKCDDFETSAHKSIIQHPRYHSNCGKLRHSFRSQNPLTLTQSCGAGLLSRGSYRRDFFRPARELQIFQPCSWLAPTANSLETVSKNPLRQGLLIQIIISQLVLFVNYFIWVKSRKIRCHNKQYFVLFHSFTAYCAGSCR